VTSVPPQQLIAGSPRRPAFLRADGSQEEFPFYFPFARGERVLDVGCGAGFHLRHLLDQGCDAVGIDVTPDIVQQLQDEGLPVLMGVAEHLPFPPESFDGLICCVVVPYTDERKAIGEWTRVLKPGGRVRASFHGLGFALDHVFHKDWVARLYGGRQLANTWCYQLLGHRLPGFLGDALCQTSSRLKRYYHQVGLELEAEYIHPGPAGFPRFVYHDLRKTNGGSAS